MTKHEQKNIQTLKDRQKAWRTADQDHFESLQERLIAWKQLEKNWEMTQDICTGLYWVMPLAIPLPSPVTRKPCEKFMIALQEKKTGNNLNRTLSNLQVNKREKYEIKDEEERNTSS